MYCYLFYTAVFFSSESSNIRPNAVDDQLNDEKHKQNWKRGF